VLFVIVLLFIHSQVQQAIVLTDAAIMLRPPDASSRAIANDGGLRCCCCCSSRTTADISWFCGVTKVVFLPVYSRMLRAATSLSLRARFFSSSAPASASSSSSSQQQQTGQQGPSLLRSLAAYSRPVAAIVIPVGFVVGYIVRGHLDSVEEGRLANLQHEALLTYVWKSDPFVRR